MTQYSSILYVTLSLNVIALLYRCREWLFVRLFDRKNQKPEASSLMDMIDEDNGDIEGLSSTATSNINSNNAHSSEKAAAAAAMKQRHSRLLYRVFLPVYLLATAADWLQGPYKYAVYSAYGYTQHDISILFVAGFGSGMSLGSIVGGMADTVGRKKMALLYCVTYTLSCLAKHVRPFGALLVGRVLGGISTSLLFSVFDAWLIQAHEIRNIDKSLFLSESFSACNFGSSVVAILAGLLANAVVGPDDGGLATSSSLRPAFSVAAETWFREQQESVQGAALSMIGLPTDAYDTRWQAAWIYKGGGIAAFDLALVPLALCFLLALFLWDENYGDKDGGALLRRRNNKHGVLDGLRGASITIWRSPSIFGLCAVTSFFEGAMYVFILLWTPALRALDTHPEDENYKGPPLGIVFATFMVCCMLGTSIFAILSTKGVEPARILVIVLAVSSISCLIISTTSSDTMSYCAMLVFEGCIGAYYPAMSTIKGSIVPEDQRAAIYSAFRLPMNLVVLINLFSDLGFKPAFGLCFGMLGLACVLQIRVVKVVGNTTTTTTSTRDQIRNSRGNSEMEPLKSSRELSGSSSSVEGRNDDSNSKEINLPSTKRNLRTVVGHSIRRVVGSAESR